MMKKFNNILFGAHMSIGGGIHHAIERGESIGCTAIQIFTKSNRQWHAKPLQEKEIELFKETWKKSSIASIIVHAAYLINVGSGKKELEDKSVKGLIEELQRCNQLGIPYLVLHPGSFAGTDQKTCLKQIAHNLDRALEATHGHTTILLETMAGQGSSTCHTFEQIAEIIALSHHKKYLGVCFDTCHAFTAGYHFNTIQTYEKMWNDFDGIIGLSKLHAMHINDSKAECGSRLDRHAHIGKGKIGLEAFKLLFNDKRFADIPKILETPYKTIEDYIPDMETIYSLIEKKN